MYIYICIDYMRHTIRHATGVKNWANLVHQRPGCTAEKIREMERNMDDGCDFRISDDFQ